jgi:hypothetical protein
MDRLHENAQEALKHSNMIEGLAESHDVRSDDVRSLYESVLAEMKRDAVIMDFLPIFAARKVMEMLRRRGWGGPERVSPK